MLRTRIGFESLAGQLHQRFIALAILFRWRLNQSVPNCNAAQVLVCNWYRVLERVKQDGVRGFGAYTRKRKQAISQFIRWGLRQPVKRAAELGIRSIEHATLVDRESAEIVADRGAYAVPTMATIFALMEQGKELGLPPVSLEKLDRVKDAALESLAILRQAGAKMGFGTDLLGAQHVRQCTEFTLRAQVLSPIEILRSACAINAELMGQIGKLGCIRKGAAADLLVVDGNPLEDISILARNGDGLAVIMKAGQFHKRAL